MAKIPCNTSNNYYQGFHLLGTESENFSCEGHLNEKKKFGGGERADVNNTYIVLSKRMVLQILGAKS